MRPTRIFWGIALLTLSVLMLELTLTRLFSATMYYHFAFMAVSLAMFGFGVSGIFIYLIQHRLDPARTAKWLSVWAVLFALSSVFALWVVLSNPLVFSGGRENFMRLAKIYGATSLPFFFAGSAVTLAITRLARDINRLYFFDLAGAGMGCLLLIPTINLIGAINTVLLVSALGGVAAAIFAGAPGGSRAWLTAGLVVAIGLGGLTAYNLRSHRLDVRQSKGLAESDVLFSKWNSFSRVTVSGDLRKDAVWIKIDADAATEVNRNAGEAGRHQDVRGSISALAYHLKSGAGTLIIGPGGGRDVMIAREFGENPITAVEVNPIIARDVMSSEPFKSFSGAIYQQPGVRLVVDEGRSFLRGSADRYDIIQASMVDTWAATAAGAFALTENNLYTVEAFKEYAARLTDDGLLTMTRWYFEPPDQLLRLLSLSRVMMADLGVSNPARHIILVRGAFIEGERAPATYLFKKSEFTDDEVRKIEAVATENGFTLLYTPLSRPDNVFTRMLEAPDPAAVWNIFETNVAPTYDNSPFFFNSLRLSNTGRALRGVGEWQKTNLGTFVLFALLAITAVLVLLFIIGPLALTQGRALAAGPRGGFSYLMYFACLGAGFAIVEIAMIQKFILFLGHPVYALAVVLFSLLTFSAVGSYLSGRFREEHLVGTLRKLVLALVVLVLVYIVVLPLIFYNLVQMPLAVRIVIAVIPLAPLAMMMGMPMPTGIRIAARHAPEVIPWSWGVNGATSVMGSVAALVIAIFTGFNQALLVGAALYLLAIFFVTRARARGISGSSSEVAAQEKTPRSQGVF